MKRLRSTEEQIIGVLKEAEAGAKTADQARRLKELTSENAKLKRLLADAMLDQAAFKDPLAKKFCRPPRSVKRLLISRHATG